MQCAIELPAEQRYPDWMGALAAALHPPPGVPERRARPGDDATAELSRGRRIADDLAWLRQALDDPHEHGLQRHTSDRRIVWEPANGPQHADVALALTRLEERGVLSAAQLRFRRSPEPSV